MPYLISDNRDTRGRFKTALQDRECLICSKLFHPRFNTVKLCSTKCSGEYRKVRQFTQIEKTCEWCESKFMTYKNRENKARFCTHECYAKSTIGTTSGEDNNAWKGGITPVNMAIRSSKKYKEWRTAVFERDNYTCQECGDCNGNGKAVVLNADHIKPFAYFPELRLDINNGRTLCVPCHRKTETYGGLSKAKIKELCHI